MSKPANLPDDFFDSDKKSKKDQQDELTKEFEKFEAEMAALQAESEEQLKEEFDKLQEDKNLDDLDQQIVQWKRVIELEKKAEELRSKPMHERPQKKFKTGTASSVMEPSASEEQEIDDLDDIDFEDKLSNWRSKGLQ